MEVPLYAIKDSILLQMRKKGRTGLTDLPMITRKHNPVKIGYSGDMLKTGKHHGLGISRSYVRFQSPGFLKDNWKKHL
jgi:hypothetical protein